MTVKTIRAKVDLHELMLQAAKEMRSTPVAMGFQMANGCLGRIAKRALELKDEALIEELETLCYIVED